MFIINLKIENCPKIEDNIEHPFSQTNNINGFLWFTK